MKTQTSTAKLPPIKQNQKPATTPKEPQSVKANVPQPKTEEKVTSSSYSTFSLFLKEISQQIKKNEAVYNTVLKASQLMNIIKEFSKGFKNHSASSEFVTLFVDFLGFCKNKEEYASSAINKFTNFCQRQLARKWQKIRDSSYVYNKGHLKILNYIVKAPKSGNKEYGHSFHELKFDMSIEEARKVALATKKMCKEDLRAFSYLSNYFYNSCVLLDKKGVSVVDIQKKYNDILSILCTENPPAPPIQLKPGELQAHPTFQNAALIPKIQLDLSKFQTQTDKQFGLEAFIMNRAKESQKQLERFELIFKEICLNNGYHFKSGVKIKHRDQKKAMIRIQEKMLSDSYKQTKIDTALTVSTKNSAISSFIDFFSLTSQEYAEYEKKMKKMFTQIKNPISYKITDLLRGKCVFSSVEKINECCSEIKEQIKKREKEGLKLIEIDNRLAKGNSDLVMKILFGTTIAQLQLVKDLDTAEYEFSHKLYELQRSKFFSPLTQLTILNEDISTDYFTEVRALILNNINQDNNYDQKITFNQALNNFKDFCRVLELKINFLQTHPNQVDVKTMTEEQKRFKRLQKLAISQKNSTLPAWKAKLNELYFYGRYLNEMKKYNQAQQQLSLALSLFQKEKPALIKYKQGSNSKPLTPEEKIELEDYLNILFVTALNYTSMDNLQLALQKYNLQIQIANDAGIQSIDIALSLNNIGLIYKVKGDHPKALVQYKKALEIKQRIKGKGSIETAFIIQSIGNLYRDLNNHKQSLSHLNKCLEIREKFKGKNSLEVGETLHWIGVTHYKKIQYERAYQLYNKSLEIIENIKGKGSIDTANILVSIANVQICRNNHSDALECHQKCLQIYQRILGKGSYLSSITFQNMGFFYSKRQEYKQALKHHNLSLEIKEKIKGKQCIDVAITLKNIGTIHQKMLNFQDAQKCYERSLSIFEKLPFQNKEHKIVANLLAKLKQKLVKK